MVMHIDSARIRTTWIRSRLRPQSARGYHYRAASGGNSFQEVSSIRSQIVHAHLLSFNRPGCDQTQQVSETAPGMSTGCVTARPPSARYR